MENENGFLWFPFDWDDELSGNAFGDFHLGFPKGCLKAQCGADSKCDEIDEFLHRFRLERFKLGYSWLGNLESVVIAFGMKIFISVLFLISLSSLLSAKSVPIFDGKSFAGWEGPVESFRIEDGAIVGGNLKTAIPKNQFLSTKKRYGDFELRLKFKLVGERANAGVQFRTERIPNHHEVIGYQADMGGKYWGALYDESRRRVILQGPDLEKLSEYINFDEWNTYVIRCEGRHIQLWLNGHKTVDWNEPDDAIPVEGIIAVQIHSGPPTEAWYKDITIEEL